MAGDPAGGWARPLGPEIATVERVDAGTGLAGSTGQDGATVLLALAAGADAQRVLDTARAAGPVEHFTFATRRLSEVFRAVTGEDA